MQNAQVELLRDECKRDSRGNRIYSEERKQEIVAEWRTSGLTQRVFAERVGIKYGTLVAWACGKRRTRRHGAAGSIAFQEVSLASMTKAPGAVLLEVVLTDGTVVRGSHAAELALLVSELRRR